MTYPYSTADRYNHLGSYVPQQFFSNTGPGSSASIYADSEIRSLAARSDANKLPAPLYYSGMSSKDFQFPSISSGSVPSWMQPKTAHGGFRVGSNSQEIYPFEDTIIDAPRDLAYVDSLRGDHTFITTKFNQSKDLRGDIPIDVTHIPNGASVSTHGPFATLTPWRGYVY